MERRFRARLEEVRRDAVVPPGLLRGVASRLDTFLRPFLTSLTRASSRVNAGQYVQGLLSNLGAKTAEANATKAIKLIRTALPISCRIYAFLIVWPSVRSRIGL